MKNLFLVFFNLLILSGCASSYLKKSGIDKLEFGSGGGITGRYQTWSVDLQNGSLHNSDGTLKRKLDNAELNDLSKKMKAVDFSETVFNHPFNLTYFISAEGKVNNKVAWGDPAFPAPDEIKELYTFLTDLVNK